MLLMSTPKERMTPDTDGVNHINIYSRGRTDLGKFLSHFYPLEITTEDGRFCSMESYWYWLKYRDDAFRDLPGNEAKQYARFISKGCIELHVPDFEEKILRATTIKIQSAPEEILAQFYSCRLPFIHAYTQNGKYSFQYSMDGIISHLNRLRILGRKNELFKDCV